MRGYGPRRARYGRRGYHMGGMFWMIGLGLLFFSGHFWPVVLILIGISMLLSALLRESDPPPAPFEGRRAPASPPPVIINLPPASPAPTPAPAPAPRIVQLPSNCPRCGAPVRTNEVKWTGLQSAACAYCGSTLQAVKK